MLLDPDAQRVLDLIRLTGRPPIETLTPAEAREAYLSGRKALQPEPPEVAEVRDLTLPGPAGAVPVRLFRGRDCPADAPAPTLVYYHGGGWVIGDLDTHDGICRHLANAARCRVLSVHYRLAPEQAFPASVDDSLAVLRHVVSSDGAALGVDPARVAVGGDSAGGNLAAVAAIAARDEGIPLALQLLLYPGTDLGGHHPSYALDLSGFPLTAVTMRWFVDHYVPNRADRSDWRASPLRAPSLAGVAPAYVMTCGFDPLRDEGIAFADRLAMDGVRVWRVHHADQLHGFLTMGKVIRASAAALDMAAAALRLGFDSAGGQAGG